MDYDFSKLEKDLDGDFSLSSEDKKKIFQTTTLSNQDLSSSLEGEANDLPLERYKNSEIIDKVLKRICFVLSILNRGKGDIVRWSVLGLMGFGYFLTSTLENSLFMFLSVCFGLTMIMLRDIYDSIVEGSKGEMAYQAIRGYVRKNNSAILDKMKAVDAEVWELNEVLRIVSQNSQIYEPTEKNQEYIVREISKGRRLFFILEELCIDYCNKILESNPGKYKDLEEADVYLQKYIERKKKEQL